MALILGELDGRIGTRRARRTGRKVRAIGKIWVRDDQRCFQNVCARALFNIAAMVRAR